VEREDGEEGEAGEGRKVVVEEKKAWVGWWPDGDATVPWCQSFRRRAKASRYPRETALPGSEKEGSLPENFALPPPGALGGCN
jgi:hypothetical protein